MNRALLLRRPAGPPEPSTEGGLSSPAPAVRPPAVVLSGVRRVFRNGEVETRALDGVSLTIRPGEFVAILGASGSGKSTLMNVLGCLDRPTAGRYLVGGEDVAGLDPDRLAALRRDVFGFVFQQYNLLPHATAAENVEIPAIYAGLPRAERAARAAALLARLGLGDRLGHRPGQLSGGQQQRVSIARALMNGGGIILADEPTGALDSRSGREVMDLLRGLNAQGHTVVLITHDAGVAAEARRRIRIADGRVVADDGEEEGGGGAAAGEGPPPPEPPPADRARRGATLAGAAAEAVRMALRSMRGNAFRTFLTLLGIVIGVGAVIAMLAIGDGAKREVLARIEAMGTDLLLVRPGGGPGVRGGAAALTREDAAELARLPGVRAAVPEQGGSVTVRLGGIDYQTSATATSPDFPAARNWPVARGAFVEPADLREYAPVAVLGATVARALFPEGGEPVGRYVLLKNVPFQVVGVMSEKGASPFGTDQDDVVFVPLTTGGMRLFGQRHLRSVTVQAERGADMAEVQRAVEDLLRGRHGAEDFRVRNMASVLETATQTQNTFTILLGSIAAISMLVGGIGVMNIMLVGVTERTREIGIRMATGARRSDVQLQFLVEALAACTLGGLIGVAGGLATALGLGALGTPVVLSAEPVVLAFGCAAATGLAFGFLPARKASRLDPVAALSSE